MPKPFDVSASSTSLNREPVVQSPVNQSSLVAADTSRLASATQAQASNVMAHASGIIANSKMAEAQAAQHFGQIAPSIAETGLQAFAGFKKAELDKKINKEIEDWAQAVKEGPMNAAMAGVLSDASNTIFDQFAQGNLSSKDFESTINAFDEKTEQLVTAHQQGLMQPSELRARIMSITRQHINENPGLTDELFHHAQRTMELSGLSSMRDTRAELDKTLEKQQEAAVKSLEKQLNSEVGRTIHVDWAQFHADPGYRAFLNKELDRKKTSFETYSNLKQGHDADKILDEQQQNQWLRTTGVQAVEGWKAELSTLFNNVLNGGLDPVKERQELEMIHTQMVGNAGQLLRTKGLTSNAEGAKMLQDIDLYGRTIIDQMSQAKTLEAKNQILQSREQMESLMAKHELFQHFDRGAMEMLRHFPVEIIQAATLKNPATAELFIKSATSLLSRLVRNDANVVDLVRGEGADKPGISNMASLMKGLVKGQQFNTLDEVVDAYSNTQKNGSLTPLEVQNSIDDFNREIIELTRQQEVKPVNFNTQTKLQEINTNYLVHLGKAFNSTTTTGAFKDVPFSVEEMPGGGIKFVSPNSKYADDLNKAYANRINTIIQGSAALFGMNRQQSYEVFKSHFGTSFSARNTGSVGAFPNASVGFNGSGEMKAFIAEQARVHGVDPNLVFALIDQESGGNENAIGPVTKSGDRAVGLMQLMEATAKERGVNRHNPRENVVGGIRYLKEHLDKFGNVELALAAYNAGPNRSSLEKGQIPDIPETQEYVKKIMARLNGRVDVASSSNKE